MLKFFLVVFAFIVLSVGVFYLFGLYGSLAIIFLILAIARGGRTSSDIIHNPAYAGEKENIYNDN